MAEHVAIFDSTLEKLTDAEKENLQASLDSYYAVGFNQGYEQGSEFAFEAGYGLGYISGEEVGASDR